MGMSQNFCSLFTCKIRIIQVQNVDSIKSKGNLFARFYLPSGKNNKRIQLNTKKVHSKSFWWNESFTLECSCPQEFLDTLKHEESLVLELRQSKKILGSSLVGKGEVPWKEILESPNMVYKEWVKMVPCKEEEEEVPKVEVEIKIQVAKEEEEEKENNNKVNNNKKRFNYNWDECGCKKGHDHDHNAWCNSDDYDVFALGLALEAF